MRSHRRGVLMLVIGISVLMVLSILFPLGSRGFLRPEEDLQTVGAFVGGFLALFAALRRAQPDDPTDPWIGHERLAWMLLGIACLCWGLGQVYWQALEMLHPTLVFAYSTIGLANLGLGAFPLFIFLGLLLLPSATTARQHLIVLLDSLTAAGCLFTIAWMWLLGPLTLQSVKDLSDKGFFLYYCITDAILLSFLLFLLIRMRTASLVRWRSMLVLSLGLLVFIIPDFLGDVLLSNGQYSVGSWIDFGWPTGMLLIGLAAYLRSFPFQREVRTSVPVPRWNGKRIEIFPALLGLIPILQLARGLLFPVGNQRILLPVLVLMTLFIEILVIIRLVVTMEENERLMQKASQGLARHLALRAEIEVAAKIQSQLLPQRFPQTNGLDIYACSRPAQEVGGDFYDFLPATDQQPFLFVIGDISGKGLPAALFMTMTRTAFQVIAHTFPTSEAATFLSSLNDYLYQDLSEAGMFVTAFVGSYDPGSEHLLYANAGHSPVIYCSANGSASFLTADAPVLGVLPTNICGKRTISFHAGDVLVAGTDGLNEGMNTQGEMFGYERLLHTVEAFRHLPASQIGSELLGVVSRFTQGMKQLDDQTLVILKRGVDEDSDL